MEPLKWYEFEERNDNEGETWRFYVLLTESEFDFLEELIESTELCNYYSIQDKNLSEEKIDILVEYSPCGYMPTFNKIGRPVGNIFDLDESEAEYLWYKNGLRGV